MEAIRSHLSNLQKKIDECMGQVQKQMNRGKECAVNQEDLVDALQFAFPNSSLNRDKQRDYVKALLGFSSFVKHERSKDDVQ